MKCHGRHRWHLGFEGFPGLVHAVRFSRPVSPEHQPIFEAALHFRLSQFMRDMLHFGP
eukprot:CAMPEP_0115706874 /NCGR_PEP_ID=MMETSP0272-20121206/71035_1 /TAXON_ID=71861 /ORGANISM="Scrippsiella trochoidea, Strain CCMP3099" /LENGTH=57 /DNA_ID=CAMNT_0003148175 /DNA_START=9 /DNA_END=179 /DNA_ORIENTATION=-